MNGSNQASSCACKAVPDNGFYVISRNQRSCRELQITARAAEGETPAQLFKKVADTIREANAQVVALEIFGIEKTESVALQKAFLTLDFPITWVEEGADRLHPLQGLQAWALAGPAVTPLKLDGRVVGCQFESDGVHFLRLGGLTPLDITQGRKEQTRSVFECMEKALAAAGMTFADVARTWFYNYGMLEWYDDFNEVRTRYFKEHRVFDGVVPASTGIGGRNAAGAALTAGLIAAKSKGGAVSAVALPSPLQCPALDYGSSFSRAVELTTPGLRRLLLSGTASIAPDGRSEHIGDVDRQITLTMEVAHAILASRGMDWNDVTRAIAYFKDGGTAPAFARWCAAHDAPLMPFLFTHNDICRDDLLFEIELEAAVETDSGQ